MSERTVRRLVGIDLGIASQHTVRVLDGDGNLVKAARCVPAVASLTVLEQAALAGTPAGTVLEVIFEPTGPARRRWIAGCGPVTGSPRPPPLTRCGSRIWRGS